MKESGFQRSCLARWRRRTESSWAIAFDWSISRESRPVIHGGEAGADSAETSRYKMNSGNPDDTSVEHEPNVEIAADSKKNHRRSKNMAKDGWEKFSVL